MADQESYQSQALTLAQQILLLSRNTLMVEMRFLDSALSRFTYVPVAEGPLLTDGRNLYYDPYFIMRSYRASRTQPVRDYLHLVMHCIFRHMFINYAVNHTYWDLACDIAVENTITELGLPSLASPREALQADWIARLKKQVSFLTAEKLYHAFLQSPPTDSELLAMAEAFSTDNHTVWYTPPSELPLQPLDGSGDSGAEEDNSAQGNSRAGDSQDSDSASPSGQEDSGDASADAPSPMKMPVFRTEWEQDWKNLSESIQTDLETFSKQAGKQAGNLYQNLMAVNRERCDYAVFLKKFAVLGEVMQVDIDSFDPIFYTYGLQLYRNMPLIEPLEYKEVRRIREFVIAIDTSGSTSGALVQNFLQKTYNILKSTESFFTRINLHIIQCDAEIQQAVKITSQEEFDQYLQHMTILGQGGTDFRPVFTYVDQLIAQKEFQNLRGMLYFTDGWGDFPKTMPAYRTAFVFVKDDYNNLNVPPWAIKAILTPEELEEL